MVQGLPDELHEHVNELIPQIQIVNMFWVKRVVNRCREKVHYLTLVTAHPLANAVLHTAEPKPIPPSHGRSPLEIRNTLMAHMELWTMNENETYPETHYHPPQATA